MIYKQFLNDMKYARNSGNRSRRAGRDAVRFGPRRASEAAWSRATPIRQPIDNTLAQNPPMQCDVVEMARLSD